MAQKGAPPAPTSLEAQPAPGAFYTSYGFEPAQSPDSQDILKWQAASTSVASRRDRTALLCGGLVLLGLTVLRPMWDAFVLMYDPIFVFFVGRHWPMWTLVACLAVLAIYAIVVVTVFAFGEQAFKTEQTILVMASIAITGLGLALLVVSINMKRETAEAYNDIFSNCQAGSRTQRLYEYATVLQGLRQTPACRMQGSIESCAGFQEAQPYTGFLRDLESVGSCASFCWDSTSASTAYSASILDEAASNATSNGSVIALLDVPTGGLVAALREIAKDSSGEAQTPTIVSVPSAGATTPLMPASALQPGRIGNFPPTLFSTSNFQASCEGAAARDLRFKAWDTADELYWEGVLLLFSTVAIGFFRMLQLCGKQRSEFIEAERQAKRYGATQIVL